MTLGLPLIAIAPARAAGPAFTFPNGVVYADTCFEYTYSHQVYANPSTELYIELTLTGPDGLEAGYDFQYDRDGRGTFTFCDGALLGTYTVAGEARACPDGYGCTTYAVQGSFTMRTGVSNTFMRAPYMAQVGSVVSVLVKVEDERPNGYYPSSSASAYLEQQKGRRWVRIKGSKVDITNGRGFAEFRMPSSPIRVRAVQIGAVESSGFGGGTEPSISSPQNIRPKKKS